ncbi:MAG TPA: hypothetical protein VID94_15125, partial [Acidimicrobiales bacterium]
TPNTMPGPGCRNEFGSGVGPASQAEGGFAPVREDQLVPAGDPDVALAPVPGPDAGSSDTDPTAVNDPAPADEAEGQPARPAAAVPDEQALDVIRDTRDPDDGSGIGDVLFVLAIAVLGAGLLYLLWSRHHDHHTVAD